MKIVVINGHKYYWYSTGRLNMTLFEEITKTLSKNHEVKTTVVEQGYCIDEEVEKYKWADAVIYQSPINWFGVPWALKKYFDEVFAAKIFFAPSEKYGEGGLMGDKRYMFSLTCSAKESDFNDSEGFFDIRSADNIFISLHKMHQFCGFKKIETFCTYNVVKDPQVERFISRLNFHLNKHLP